MSTKADLDADLCDLVNMAHIVATLVEDSLGHKGLELTHLPDAYFINDEDANAMIFASYEVHTRLKALRDKYYDTRGIEK